MRIVFCIPGRKFSGSFLNSWTYLLRQIGPNIEWYMVNGYVPNVSYSRQALLDRAKMLRPTHYMWIDDDQVFDYKDFTSLIEHDLPIVSGLYKKSNDLFACCKLNGETLTVEEFNEEKETGLMEVQANGMGFMLVKREVFDAIENPFEHLNEHQWEDFGFANKARQAGFKSYVDTKIVIGHEKSVIL